MTRSEFISALDKEHIPLDDICFDWEYRDGVICIRENYGTWEVFIRDRGQEFGMHKYSSESDALEYLYHCVSGIRRNPKE
jgi:hypothetical protein